MLTLVTLANHRTLWSRSVMLAYVRGQTSRWLPILSDLDRIPKLEGSFRGRFPAAADNRPSSLASEQFQSFVLILVVHGL